MTLHVFLYVLAHPAHVVEYVEVVQWVAVVELESENFMQRRPHHLRVVVLCYNVLPWPLL